MNDNETKPGTEEQSSAVNSTSVDSQQEVNHQETDVDANILSAPAEDMIPEKFIGKSPLEIAKAYQELERMHGRIASEKGHAEKKAEEAAARAAALEAQLQQASAQRQQQHQDQDNSQQDMDPIQVLEKQWDESPREAIKQALKVSETREAQKRFSEQMKQQVAATTARYHEMKAKNSDFVQLEPTMVELSKKYGALLRPEVLNSPETLDILYDLAKAKNLDAVVEQRLAAKQKTTASIKEEKRKVFSESSRSEGDSSRPFSSLSLEEMKKVLGRSDK